TILSAAATLPAFADMADAGSPYDDEVIVTGQYLYSDQVTALRSPTPIIDVPQSLTLFTADEIAQRGFTSIGQIVDYTPGITTSQGEGHRDAIVFRGVRSTADFFIDGVRDDVQYYRSLYNLEQVEILRGPNALLFGRGGTGGLVNRVTKKGVLGETFAGATLAVDTFGAFDGMADLNYAVGDRAAVRLNAAFEALNNHRDLYDGERIGLNPTARVALTPQTILDLSYEFADHERFVDRGIPSLDGGPAEFLEDVTFGTERDNVTTLEAHVLNATLQHRFNDHLKANATAFYGDYDKVYSNLYPSDSYDPVANAVEIDGYLDETRRERILLSGNLVGEFRTGVLAHTVVAGVEYIDTASDQFRFNTVFSSNGDDQEVIRLGAGGAFDLSGRSGTALDGTPTTFAFTDLNDDTRVDVKVASAYLQNEIAVSDHFDIVLGGRFDRFDIEVFNAVADETRSRVDNEFSPRLGLIYKPRETVSLYGSFSETFLPRSGEQFTDINGADNVLDPNIFQNLEAGLKWDFASGLSFTAAVFEIEQTSPQVSDLDPDTLDVIETTIEGLELQLFGTLSDRWTMTAGYSYLTGDQANGLRPRELPRHTVNGWTHFEVTDRFGLGAGFTYQDESFAGNDQAVILPDYIRVDAAAHYDVSERVRLQLNVENLFDTDYFPNAHTNNNLTVGRPLNARFSLQTRF
ncbi:MAG: TonB-dependent siderophore receptor, partial [Pseudomonadota bacterium]